MQYKALDQSVQTIAEGGRKVSTTYRCADMDRVVPGALGVDAAILDAVVFVHQDESTWPLGDTATLKKKFDDIFAATKYTKALETLRKVRVETAGKAKTARLQLDGLHAEQASGAYRWHARRAAAPTVPTARRRGRPNIASPDIQEAH